MNKTLRALALAGLLTTAVGVASAASCGVAAVTLVFGNYNPLGTNHDDSTGNVTVACDSTPGEVVSYTIALNPGGSGTFAARRMRSSASASLTYNLYTTAARSMVWGDGTAGTLVVSDAIKLLTRRVSRNYPVYGRAFVGQNVPVGIYTDSIVVTLNF